MITNILACITIVIFGVCYGLLPYIALWIYNYSDHPCNIDFIDRHSDEIAAWLWTIHVMVTIVLIVYFGKTVL